MKRFIQCRLLYVVCCILGATICPLWAIDCPVNGVSTTPETCAGDHDGTATISVAGNAANYTYTWLPNVSNTATANNLAPGAYSVTVSGSLSGSGTSTTTLFSDNFNSGADNWVVNASGAGLNRWFVDANYTGGSCNFLGSSLFTVPDVAAQPAAITGSPYSTYLHIRATSTAGGLCNPPWPPLNASYDGGETTTNRCTEMALPVSTLGQTGVSLQFYWLCGGSTNSYGYVQYQTNSAWQTVGDYLYGEDAWQTANIANAAFDNQSSLKYRFCWNNNSTGVDPAIAIDDVSITATSSSTPCSSVLNFSIAAGTAPDASFNDLADSYCQGNAPVILTPTVAGGTFSGESVSNNTFNPRFVTTVNTPIPITYTLTQNGCTASVTQNVTVIPQPNASFTPQLNATYYPSDPPIVLTPVVAGGTWSGDCLASNVFIPSVATLNVPCNITYTLTQNGCTSMAAQGVTVISPPITAKIKVLLQGAYSGGNTMRTDLQSNNLLPLAQPYNSAPFNYNGTEAVASASAFPSNTCDWVLVEIRDAANPATLYDRKAALLLADGTIVNTDGTAGVNVNVSSGNYYIAVRHRNHLAAMSAATIALPNAIAYDFTTAATQTFGTEQAVAVSPTHWAMRCGDAQANGTITFADYNAYIAQVGSGNTNNGYFAADIDLDGDVSPADFDLYRPNARMIGIAPLRY